MIVVSICIFWLLFVSHFFHFFYHIFRLSNCEDKAFYNWILSNNGSVHNFYLRKVFLKLWIDLSIIILFKAVKFQDDTLAQDIIFLTADWSNFDLLDTAIIPVKIFAFFFWKNFMASFRSLLNLQTCPTSIKRDENAKIASPSLSSLSSLSRVHLHQSGWFVVAIQHPWQLH